MEGDSNSSSIIKNTYKIKEFLGKGSYSKVYSAEDINNKKLYAIKILSEDNYFEFEKEIKMNKIVSSLKNPYVINMIECGEEEIKIDTDTSENKQYIVLDYASKGELFDYIDCVGGVLDNKIAKLIFHKIVKGLEAIHNSGICHRDLKMNNVLLDEFFNPKICDFGLAAKLMGKNGPTKLYRHVGTKKYSAPELFKKEDRKMPYDGIKVDIFSLGIVLINIIIGKYGFGFAIEDDYYYKYIYENKFDEYWNEIGYSSLDKDLKNLYFKMVSFEPERRPTIKEILESPWMKEITVLNEKEYKELEKKLYEEFKQIEIKILDKNGTVKVKESIDQNDGGSRDMPDETIYFDLDLNPKYVGKRGLNMKYYMKIIGKVNPSKLMNTIAKNIKKKYGDKININIPSHNKLKFDVFFNNIDEKDDEEKEEEEKEEEEKEEDEKQKDENNEEDEDNIERGKRNEEIIIQVKLFESYDGGYIVRFTKKNGETIGYHKYLDDFRNIIKELDSI